MCKEVISVDLPVIRVADIDKPITLEMILKAACDVTGVTMGEAISKNRKREIVEARRMYMYFAYENHYSTCTKIGDLVNRDRTETLYHHKKVTMFLTTNEKHTYERYINNMKHILNL